ncbi:MAG: chromate transporter [Burkholderiales bacterium]|nr:chromate transporter [Burkholderiales bacterium]
MSDDTLDRTTPSAAPCYTMWQLVRYMLGLGTWGFGGPVALVGYMYRDLVDKRGWITESEYKEGLTLAQLMPGPLAAQLAIYLGFVHHRFAGATLVGLAFVLPSFFMVIALGEAYVAFGGIGWMQAVFYGVGAAVIGIIAVSAWKLTTKNIGRDKLLWAIFLVNAVATAVLQAEVVWAIVGAGILVWLLRAPPSFGGAARVREAASGPLLAALALGSADPDKLLKILGYFTYAGTFVFGSGLAIVPFLYGGVVKEYHWLTDRQFVDAVAVAMITPGPVVITTAFIGFLVQGFWGGVMAAAGTFLPCYLLTILPAPYFRKHGKRPGLLAFINGATAAAIGAIAGSVVVIGQRSVTDWLTALLAVGTALLLWRFKKLTEPVIVLAAAAIGLVAWPLLHHV